MISSVVEGLRAYGLASVRPGGARRGCAAGRGSLRLPSWLERFADQLDQVLDGEPIIEAAALDCIRKHHVVLGARNHQEVDAVQRSSLPDPGDGRALPDLAFLHPDAPAAGAAAQRPVAMAGHLD